MDKFHGLPYTHAPMVLAPWAWEVLAAKAFHEQPTSPHHRLWGLDLQQMGREITATGMGSRSMGHCFLGRLIFSETVSEIYWFVLSIHHRQTNAGSKPFGSGRKRLGYTTD